MPSCAKRGASSVTGAGAHHVRLFLDDVEGAVSRQVDGDTLGLVEDDPQLVQRLDDLDAVPDDALIQPVVVMTSDRRTALCSSPRRIRTNASFTPRFG